MNWMTAVPKVLQSNGIHIKSGSNNVSGDSASFQGSFDTKVISFNFLQTMCPTDIIY